MYSTVYTTKTCPSHLKTFTDSEEWCKLKTTANQQSPHKTVQKNIYLKCQSKCFGRLQSPFNCCHLVLISEP